MLDIVLDQPARRAFVVDRLGNLLGSGGQQATEPGRSFCPRLRRVSRVGGEPQDLGHRGADALH
ncbi:MAG: hypothetical protein U1E14_00125, partial [Geminicoccaceae bacterium]